MGGSVALLVKKPIQYQVLNNLNDLGGKLEVCGARIFSNDGPRAAKCHFSVQAASWLHFCSWVVLLFFQFQNDSLYLGDLNAYYSSWGNNHSCSVNKNLFSSLIDSDFFVLNDGFFSWFQPFTNFRSAIDLSITNSVRLLKSSWRVLCDYWGSDHFPITLSLPNGFSQTLQFFNNTRLHKKRTD